MELEMKKEIKLPRSVKILFEEINSRSHNTRKTNLYNLHKRLMAKGEPISFDFMLQVFRAVEGAGYGVLSYDGKMANTAFTWNVGARYDTKQLIQSKLFALGKEAVEEPVQSPKAVELSTPISKKILGVCDDASLTDTQKIKMIRVLLE